MGERPVALVTGANKGIGKEICRQLAQQGMIVFAGSRDVDRGRLAARELATDGLAVTPVRLDVTANDTVAATADRLGREHGRLELLINNAGAVAELPVPDLTDQDVRPVFEVNVFGVVTVVHTMLPLLRAARAARIVNVSSTTASLALTDGGTDFGGDADVRAAYSMSKTALNMLTVQYARAFAKDPELSHIEVTSVTPGYTATDLTGHRGTRTAAEGARVIVENASSTGGNGGFFGDAGAIPW